MTAALALLAGAVITHILTHALTYRSGTAWEADLRAHTGVIAGLGAVVLAFYAGMQWS